MDVMFVKAQLITVLEDALTWSAHHVMTLLKELHAMTVQEMA
jgi:hypothetical protein